MADALELGLDIARGRHIAVGEFAEIELYGSKPGGSAATSFSSGTERSISVGMVQPSDRANVSAAAGALQREVLHAGLLGRAIADHRSDRIQQVHRSRARDHCPPRRKGSR